MPQNNQLLLYIFHSLSAGKWSLKTNNFAILSLFCCRRSGGHIMSFHWHNKTSKLTCFNRTIWTGWFKISLRCFWDFVKRKKDDDTFGKLLLNGCRMKFNHVIAIPSGICDVSCTYCYKLYMINALVLHCNMLIY